MLKECDKNEMIEFVSKLLSKSNECRRKLSVQVVGSSLDGEEKSSINSDEEATLDLKYCNASVAGEFSILIKQRFLQFIVGWK